MIAEADVQEDCSVEILKFVVDGLSKPPFNMSYNVVSFGSLNQSTLLQVLHKVLCDIDPKHKEAFPNPPVFLTYNFVPHINAIIDLLSILNFKKNFLYTLDDVREALENSGSEILWRLLAWLLHARVELKERAYLAQFLVRVQIPTEIIWDEDVALLYQQYEDQIDSFKQVHMKLKKLKRQAEDRSVPELVEDYKRIEHDFDCLSRKVETAKEKVMMYPEKGSLLPEVRLIRKEKQSGSQMHRQMVSEIRKIESLDCHQERLQVQIQDLVSIMENDPDSLVRNIEQDTELLKAAVEEKLPKEIDQVRRQYSALRRADECEPHCRADLDQLKERIHEVQAEIETIRKLSVKPNVSDSSNDVCILVGKRKLEVNMGKKQSLLENIRSMQEELDETTATLDNMRQNRNDDDVRMTPQEEQEYVQQYRVKHNHYKELRAELEVLQAEQKTLVTTKFALDEELEEHEAKLYEAEESLGIAGFSTMQDQLEATSDMKTSTDAKKIEHLKTMSNMTEIFREQLRQGQLQWEAFLSTVKEKRMETERLKISWEESKADMEEEMGPTYELIEDMEQDNDAVARKFQKDTLLYAKRLSEIPILMTQLARCKGTSASRDDDDKLDELTIKRNLNALRSKLVEGERVEQVLHGQLEEIGAEVAENEKQRKMWTDVTKLLEMKIMTLEDSNERKGSSTASSARSSSEGDNFYN